MKGVDGMECVKIQKKGSFYYVYGEDSYIIYFFFQYKLKDNKIGFPKSSLNKVVNTLDEFKINYNVDSEDMNANYKDLNKYRKYVQLGKGKYEKDIHYKNIIDKLCKINPDKLEKVLSTIETILDE